LLGVVSVTAASGTVIYDGLQTQGSLEASIRALSALPLWPQSVTSYFQSFGSVVYLFCVNFLIFPIEANMAARTQWPQAVERAVLATAAGNILFAALAFSFYGDQTQEIVLNNLGPGQVLSAVKVLLCLDLFASYPLVLAAATDIVERALLPTIGDEDASSHADADRADGGSGRGRGGILVGPEQAFIRSALVGTTMAVAQAKGFSTITNVAGGLAQGTLAFILPGALVLQLKGATMPRSQTAAIKMLIGFGFVSAFITTYLALVS
jgi:hypothetical protein